jgi:NAD(P)-dependent dehydrogenase (short-subunit alcohol dehydrogenase family)
MIGIDMSDQVVVITGSSGGIGAGIARRFAEAGASLVLHHHHAPPPRFDSPTAVVRADLTSTRGPETIVDAALDAYGRMDSLVNCAGAQPSRAFAEVSTEDWDDMISTNITAAHRLSQLFAAKVVASGNAGSIVHVASIEGHQPAVGHSHYAVSKAALIMHAKAAALELGPSGVRVNSVSPGLIHREGIEQAWPEGVSRWRAAAPLGRLGQPSDVGDACVFLCSPLAAWITGIDLVVDGGVSARPSW